MQAAVPVCRWLQTKGIVVQKEWLEACIEWIQSEEGSSLPLRNLQELVYEQWLHADLRDVVTRTCVPLCVTQQQTSQITGQFIVQMDSLVGVGAPAYGQLQKLKGQSLDTADAPNEKFESKPTRLLLLNLTDGVVEFQAMEYQSIPRLNTQILPGTKLLLQGGIKCRLGLLLLTASHVQVLGGKVDALIEKNQQMKILARMLNNENLADEDDKTKQPAINQQSSHRSHDGHSLDSVNDVMIMDVVPAQNRQDHSDQAGSSRGKDIGNTLNTRGEQQWLKRHPISGHSSVKDEVVIVDDFSGPGIIDHRVGGDGHTAAYGGGLGIGDTGLSDPATEIRDVDFEDFEDFGVDPEIEQEGTLCEEVPTSRHEGEQSLHRSEDLKFGDLLRQDSKPWMKEDVGYGAEVSRTELVSTTGRYGAISTHNDPSSSRQPTCSSMLPEKLATRLSLKQKGSARSDIKYRETVTNSAADKLFKKPTVPVAPVKPFGLSLVNPSMIKEEPELSNPELKFPRSRFAGDCGNESAAPVCSLAGLSLSSAWRQYPVLKVKAHFVKVVEKLCHESGVWMVTVLLGDDSGAKLKVHLSNEILEMLIGFSAREFRELRLVPISGHVCDVKYCKHGQWWPTGRQTWSQLHHQHIMPNKSDRKVKAKASQGFRHCQSALADLSCFMELRMRASHPYPFIEKLLDA